MDSRYIAMANIAQPMRSRIAFEALLMLPVMVTLLCVIGCTRELSGTYLGKDPDGLCWLEIVRTPDSHLTGHLVTMIIGSDGKVDQRSVELRGVSDGGNIVLSSTALLQPLMLSGDLKGDRLTLTGSQPVNIVLIRSDLNEYQKEADSLTNRSQQLLAEKAAAKGRLRVAQAQQKLLSDIDGSIRRMDQFVAAADVALSRFPAFEEKFHNITSTMRNYVNVERKLATDPNTAVRRGQLIVAANQASIETEQLRTSIESFESSASYNSQSIKRGVWMPELECNGPADHDLNPEEIEARNRACSRLVAAEKTYRQKLDALTAGLAHLHHISTQEREAQQALLQTAQRFQ